MTVTAKTARENLKRLDDSRADLLGHEQAFLRSRGWSHTSHTPGFVWLWTRELQGVVIMMTQTEALACERSILSGDTPIDFGAVNHASR